MFDMTLKHGNKLVHDVETAYSPQVHTMYTSSRGLQLLAGASNTII